MSDSPATPKVGFISLGCPKALVDSEQILTQLRAEGYDTAKSYDGADLVIVNTCGFIDAAVTESLDAIGEALNENGKVIVTGCLGGKKDASGQDVIRTVHPKVLAVTGPHALAEVMKRAPKMRKDQTIVMNMCGRGDKDVFAIAERFGVTL